MDADVLIVGAGIIGLASAYHIASSADLSVIVVDRNPAAAMGSTSKATGGIRQQFSSPINVRLSQVSLGDYQRFAAEMGGQEIGLRQHGYLFVTTSDATLARLAESVSLQQSLGVPSRIVGSGDVAELFPAARTDDLVGGSYCATDGSANPADAASGYKREASSQDVRFLFGEAVQGFVVTDGIVTGARLESGRVLVASTVVNAAGPGAVELAATAGFELMAQPYRRQVFVTSPMTTLSPNLPMLVDLDTGWYVHQEASGALILGGTDATSRPGLEETVDWDGFEQVADAAQRRIPSIADDLQIKSAYCGIRTLTPDELPILGRPAVVDGLISANACNGHGFMHAPAVGRVVADLVTTGQTSLIDMDAISPDRFVAAQAGSEAVVF